MKDNESKPKGRSGSGGNKRKRKRTIRKQRRGDEMKWHERERLGDRENEWGKGEVREEESRARGTMREEVSFYYRESVPKVYLP